MSFRPTFHIANQQHIAPREQVQVRPYCARCRRFFVNQRALNQHLNYSNSHHICPNCDIDYESMHEMEACQCDDDSEGQSIQTDEESTGTASDEGISGVTWADIAASLGYGYRTVDEDYQVGYYHDYNSYTDEWTASEGWDDESGSGESTGTLEEDDTPLPRQEEESYCPRCNRHFQSIHGYRSHCRMSSAHPWWCNQCHTDFDRETDLNSHIAATHNDTPLSYQNPPLSRREYPNLREAMAAQSAEAATRRASQPQSSFGSSNTTTQESSHTHQLRSPTHPHEISRALNTAMSFSNLFTPTYSRTLPERDDEERSGSFLMPGAFIESPTTPSTTVNQPPVPPGPSTSASSTPANPEASETAKAAEVLNLTCPLCLEHPQVLTSTLCGHLFCKECITLALRRKPECPVCRAYSHVPSLHPIYLNVTGTVV